MSVSRSQRGGSLLLEILLGMTLLIMAVMAVFALFPVGDRAVVNSDRSTQAHHLARRLLEEEMSKEYASMPIGSVSGDKVLDHSRRNGVNIQTKFHYEVTIAQPDPDKELKQVVVKVRWERGSSDPRDLAPVVLESMKGRVL